jgi:radical SAM superfamily enzyme YgiQ (UPF0313 family)
MISSGIKYEGPIYRPPSEANSLLIQATVGCPHNKCTFCMVYKNGPKFRIRSVEEIKSELLWAKNNYKNNFKTVFFPSGNTIVMKTDDLIEICRYTRELFPYVERITVYGSAQYIIKKSIIEWNKIANAGLSRIHVGLESGDDIILKKVNKGSTAEIQEKAGLIIKQVGIQLSEYVILGLGGKERTSEHIKSTIEVLNNIDPDFIRIRTFLPKVNTPILNDIKSGVFKILNPHEVLNEVFDLIDGLKVNSLVFSDHYTNYISVNGKLPEEKEIMLKQINDAMKHDISHFREVYIGRE